MIALLALALALSEPDLPPCADGLAQDLHACDAVLAAERDPKVRAQLFYRRGYILNEKQQYEAAVADLDAAIAADPGLAAAWHERSYAHSELREFAKAAADSDRDVALRPDASNAYGERAFARHGLGDLQGAWEDRAKFVSLEPTDIDGLLGRGRAALWLGRFEDARADAAKGLAMADAAGNRDAAASARALQALITLWTTRSNASSPEAACRLAEKQGRLEAKEVIGDCTAAFLAARTPHAKAEMLSTRALAFLVAAQDQVSAVDDQAMAVAFEPDNADWHANLGGSYVMVHHSWAGRRELDIAIRLKDGWVARAQRAAARYNLRDFEGAFADARKSFEMHPNEVALVVLGDLAHDKGDDKSARLDWMGAYRLGSRDDGLLTRLKGIGVTEPDKEPLP
jgi:tetratricopeptide (TPR) repeat protein